MSQSHRNKTLTPNTKTSPGQVRIIGGTLRGSKLPVADVDALRPTSDRVRETVFNWLESMQLQNPGKSFLRGGEILDLFAGSGALAFEALSRGAALVDMVEKNPTQAAVLKSHAQRFQSVLGNAQVRVWCADALTWQAPGERYNLVLLDPPFASTFAAAALQRHSTSLCNDALLYLEQARGDSFVPAPPWRNVRNSTAGNVQFSLWARA